MVTKELSEAAVEFNCILDNSSQEIIDKIPQKFIKFMKNIASTTYTFNYDKSKQLNEQDIKPETRGLISLVYQDYICSEDEKKDYILKCKNHEIKKEEELREKYNLDNVFKNRKKLQNTMDNEVVKENAIIEYKEKNFIQKIFDKIKQLFKRID